MANTLLCFLVLFVFIRAGDCIHCYVCNGTSCADPVNRNELQQTECNLEALAKIAGSAGQGLMNIAHMSQSLNVDFACMKYNARDPSSGKSEVVRTCMFAKSEKFDTCALMEATTKMTAGEKISVDYCDICNEDLCNGSSLPSYSTILLFVTVSSALFFSY